MMREPSPKAMRRPRAAAPRASPEPMISSPYPIVLPDLRRSERPNAEVDGEASEHGEEQDDLNVIVHASLRFCFEVRRPQRLLPSVLTDRRQCFASMNINSETPTTASTASI